MKISTKHNLKRLTATAAALLLTLVLPACGGGGGSGGTNPPPPPPPPSRTAETIVYVADDGVSTNGMSELYVVRDDGSNPQRVSHEVAASNSRIFDFALSPDAQWVAWTADAEDGFGAHLYVNAVSGGTPVQVSQVTSAANRRVDSFQWSPDSSQLVFAGNFDIPLTRGDQAREVWVVNRDGSGLEKINGGIGATPGVDVARPQWSPDGRYIVQGVFTFDNGANSAAPHPHGLNVHDRTGSARNSRRLITSNTSILDVNWSPDSNRLSYTADRLVQNEYQVFAISVDGSGETRVTQNGDFLSESAWSPDSSLLAYLDHPSAPFPADLFVSGATAGAPDTVLAFLSANGRQVLSFAWSPDGQMLAYVANANTDTVFELFVVPADGSSPGVAVNPPLAATADIFTFAWSPDSTRIAYAADQFTNGVPTLFVVGADGSNNTHLMDGLSGEELGEFDWSDDGALLRFSTGPESRTVNADTIYASAPDGSGRVRISDGMLGAPILFRK